jgi:hypothetical protein
MMLMSKFKAGLRRGRELACFYYTQRVKGFDPPDRPQLDPETGRWLEDRLGNTELFLEFGSGGSTVLANELGIPTISVESDRFYAEAVRKALRRSALAQIIVPRMGLTSQWGMPVLGKSRKGRRYVEAPFGRLGEQFPDFVMVDGRYRVACALTSARQANLARGRAQLMMDDYRDRPFYHAVEDYLGAPTRIGRAAVFEIGEREISQAVINRFVTDAR